MSAAVLATFGLALNSFGSTTELASSDKPWFGSRAEDPLIWVVRVEEVGARSRAGCTEWKAALEQLPIGRKVGNGSKNPAWDSAWVEWDPWTAEDLKVLRECVSSPCKIKLDPVEAAQLGAADKNDRKRRLRDLVHSRVLHYEQSGIRRGYEKKGRPVDPWERFAKEGFVSSMTKPAASSFWIRKLVLDPERLRPVRQVLDRRFAESDRSATLWVRDAYSAHYFDSWGEWSSVMCDEGSARVQIVQALLVELDLLKKTDLISRVSRVKMRKAVSEKGKEYLQRSFERLRKLAGAGSK